MRSPIVAKFVRRLPAGDLPQGTTFLGATFTFLLVLVIVATALLEHTRAERERLVKTVETQGQLDELLAAMTRLESGQRGYLLTGDSNYLKIYWETLPTVSDHMKSLENAIAHDQAQKNRVDAIEPLVNGKLNELAETIRLHQEGKREEAIAIVRSEAGVHYMSDIRQLVSQMKSENGELRFEQYNDARNQERWLLAANVLAATVIVVLAAISVFSVRRANAAIQNAHDVLRDANAELEAKVAERTAELTAANEEIQRFAYIVSHDLRSPLVNIMGFTSELEELKKTLLERLGSEQAPHSRNGNGAERQAAAAISDNHAAGGEFGEEFDEAIAFIKASITKMDRLINAVLKISREGSRTLEPERIDLGNLLDIVTKAVAHQTQNAGADIEIGELPTIISDRLALEQIFSNLLDNALKYLRHDVRGHIRVTGALVDSKVTIAVSDNGRGISERDRARIFEMFRRAAGSQDQQGEGMGLAHVRALVRRIGGMIGVESVLGEGSTFTVTLPRTLPHETRRMNV
jgi:hypothetical protein